MRRYRWLAVSFTHPCGHTVLIALALPKLFNDHIAHGHPSLRQDDSQL